MNSSIYKNTLVLIICFKNIRYSSAYLFGMDEQIILYILQVAMIYNAISLGWNVKKVNNKKFILTKIISKTDKTDLNKFMDTLLVIRQ